MPDMPTNGPVVIVHDTRVDVAYWALHGLAGHVDGDCWQEDGEDCPTTSLCVTEWCVACVAHLVIHDIDSNRKCDRDGCTLHVAALQSAQKEK